jgi:hypothetical protein
MGAAFSNLLNSLNRQRTTTNGKKGDRLLLVEKGKKGTGYFLQYKEGGYK